MKRIYQCFTDLRLQFLVIAIVLSVNIAIGDPRSQFVELFCGKQVEHNATLFGANFVVTMEKLRIGLLNGSATAVTGVAPDASYGLAQCYGDLSSDDCQLCFSAAGTNLTRCSPSNAGQVYFDGCFLRSGNYSFYLEYTGPDDKAVCGNTKRKSAAFQDSARQAVAQAVSTAQKNKGYARVGVAVSGSVNESAYVLANCWETLSISDCKACLDNASSSISGCFPWSEGRALNTGCFMRYSDVNFLNKQLKRGTSVGIRTVIAVSVSIAVLVVGTSIGIFVRNHRRTQKKRKEKTQFNALLANMRNSKLRFPYETLEKAANYFSASNKLGQGGSATVYKGILPNGKAVAIKRLFFDKQWAAHLFNEVDLISSTHHKNIVTLLGYSVVGPESLLVYEYVSNGSLYDHILGNRNSEPLTWGVRCNIILGTAEGLAHLHDESNMRIIHRDIKLGNILLDADFTAKIADFGLARLFPKDKSHVYTDMAGTFGYMAPEYVFHGKLTEKADVYSFGVLVSEVISGRRSNSASQNAVLILKNVWELYTTGRLHEAVDPVLVGDFQEDEASRLFQIALLCVQASAEMRPSMSTVVKMLTDNFDIPRPTEPPYINLFAESSSCLLPSVDSTQPDSFHT